MGLDLALHASIVEAVETKQGGADPSLPLDPATKDEDWIEGLQINFQVAGKQTTTLSAHGLFPTWNTETPYVRTIFLRTMFQAINLNLRSI